MKPSALLGYRIGAVLGIALLVFMFLPHQDRMLTVGPPNSGHETLACASCHVAAAGTMRQQIQANVRHWLGLRSSGVPFQHLAVSNEACIACHDNPKDNHPAHRFNEPRFATARAAIHPEQCVSCHLEHQGVRVTQPPTLCVYCHQDLKLQNDPLDVSHEKLVADGNWASCLGCHDFHGNHDFRLRTKVADAIRETRILRYFNGGPSPYANPKFFPAKGSEDTND